MDADQGPSYATGRVVWATPCWGDKLGALAVCEALASDAPLRFGQRWLATHVHPTLPSSSLAGVSTLQDALALALSQCAPETVEAATYGPEDLVWREGLPREHITCLNAALYGC